MPQHGKIGRYLLAVAILLIAFALRIAAITQVPPGLSHDEAYNGVTAIQVLDGQRLIFFEINKGIEPLIIYLEALAFHAFGIGPVQLRLVNIFCGMLTVVLVYPLAVRLFNRRVALLAMAGMAVSFWAVFVSRLTLRAVTLPPLLMLTLYWFWLALNTKSPLKFFVLSGIAAGAAMYTYLSSRVIPLLVLAIFGYQLLRGQIRRQHWLGLLIHLAIWAAILTPLVHYFWQDAASFTERSSQVTTIPHALNGEFGPMIRNTIRTLGMFTFHGDDTDRYNLDGRPVFDWVNGLLFYLGLIVALLRLRHAPKQAGPAALLFLWLFFMLLPDFITDDSPHFLRTIGVLPAIYLTWALGLDWGMAQIDKQTRSKIVRPLPATAPKPYLAHHLSLLAVLLLLLFTAMHTSYDYFGRWASAEEARDIYGADVAEIARYLKSAKDEGLVAISAEYFRDLDPFRFSLHFQGAPPFVIWFDGRQSLAFPPAESGLSPRYLFAASAPAAEPWLPLLQTSPAESGRSYTLYRLLSAEEARQSWARLFPSGQNLNININNELRLLNYQLLGTVVSGGKFFVLLGWQALQPLPPGTDYTFVAQLRDKQGHVWARADGLGYSPADWQPGVQALQLLTFRLPGDLPARTYWLNLAVVDRQTGRALPAAGGQTVVPLTTVAGRLDDKPQVMDLERLPNPIREEPGASPTQTDSSLMLRGYRLNRSSGQAGDVLPLTLHWQVLKQPQQDYMFQFFLAGEQNEPVPVYRWPPVSPIGGEWPTSQWPAGYWVQDRLDLPVSSDMPAGRFKLWLSLVPQEAVSSSSIQPLIELDWIDIGH